MPVLLKKTIPFTVKIDGQDVRLSIKRMTVEEYATFGAQFIARNKQQRTGPEPAGSTLAEQIQRDVDDGLEYARWVCEVFEQFVTIHPDDLQFENEAITKGGRFAELLAAYDDVVATVLAKVFLANRLSDAQKKTSRSPSASASGSEPPRQPEVSGSAPATIADSAAPSSSVESAAAADLQSNALSGATAASSSEPAPSGS